MACNKRYTLRRLRWLKGSVLLGQLLPKTHWTRENMGKMAFLAYFT